MFSSCSLFYGMPSGWSIGNYKCGVVWLDIATVSSQWVIHLIGIPLLVLRVLLTLHDIYGAILRPPPYAVTVYLLVNITTGPVESHPYISHHITTEVHSTIDKSLEISGSMKSSQYLAPQ